MKKIFILTGEPSGDKLASKVIQEKLKKMGGSGGIIGIDRNLNSVMEFNTKGMYRATYINDSIQIKIQSSEDYV